MWKAESDRAYPFRHQHTDHFPPRPPPLCIPPPLTPDRIPLSTCFEESDENEDAEIPIIYHSPLVQRLNEMSYSASAFSEPRTSPPCMRDIEPPPTPSSLAPANLTNLLQDVLGVMNTIMESRAEVEEEDSTLQELAELVIIMQEEAEMLIEVSDLTEEYCAEVESEVEIQEMEEWCLELGIGSRNQPCKNGEGPKLGHEREDSGVGLDEKFEGGDDFVDDRSLQEMEAPTSPAGDSSGVLHDKISEETKDFRDRNQKAEQQAPTIVVTPPEKPVSVGAKGLQKPLGPQIEEVTPKSKRPVKKNGKIKKIPPPFRDSGLGLQTPSPCSSPSTRSPRWI